MLSSLALDRATTCSAATQRHNKARQQLSLSSGASLAVQRGGDHANTAWRLLTAAQTCCHGLPRQCRLGETIPRTALELKGRLKTRAAGATQGTPSQGLHEDSGKKHTMPGTSHLEEWLNAVVWALTQNRALKQPVINRCSGAQLPRYLDH